MLRVTGPFDRRTKRIRCMQCATSHSKCSGGYPCSNCQRRRVCCSFPASQSSDKGAVIALDRGKHFTAATFKTANTPEAPLPDTTTRYLYYFDVFVHRNSFRGQGFPFLDDVKRFIKGSGGLGGPGSHLLSALLAVGAMQANKTSTSIHQGSLRFALESYAHSIVSLRSAMSAEQDMAVPRANVLWTTFFLGLFELMQDSSGHGWLQHMIYGTSRALVASGPSSCTSGPTRAFFIQARTFEVCRAIIFNEPTFLAKPEWMDVTSCLRSVDVEAGRPSHDALLDLVVMSSHLRVRTSQFIDSLLETPEACHYVSAGELAAEGFRIRDALNNWDTQGSNPLPVSSRDTDQETLLESAFFAATSIYLSGNYDYELEHWQQLNIPVPILGPEDILVHFIAIIQSAGVALKRSSLSPLLFLFPLRVAGARAHEEWQQQAVLELLYIVKKEFVVAEAFLVELKELWRARGSSVEEA